MMLFRESPVCSAKLGTNSCFSVSSALISSRTMARSQDILAKPSLPLSSYNRLAILARHISSSTPELSSVLDLSVACFQEVALASGSERRSLTVIDNRTGKKYEIAISEGSTIKAADFKKITAGGDGNGLKLYDPGCVNTAPVRSSISHTDGNSGTLWYRGYPIEELAEKSTYMEVSYLLIYGYLPTKVQLCNWKTSIAQHAAIPEGILSVINALPDDSHPMGSLICALSALSSFNSDTNPAFKGQDIYRSKFVQEKKIVHILGQVPTLAAAIYMKMAGRHTIGLSSHMSITENFLYMLDSFGDRTYRSNPRLARALEVLFILHAEHDMNCSTAAARHLASSGVDVYMTIAGATGAMYGPLHGGANEAVLKMLYEIGSINKIPEFLEGVRNRKRKMSGFGHRVYKNYDPRAKIVKSLAEEVFSIVGHDPLIEVARALEAAAVSDEYFMRRKLYPNVDFYSGLIYKALGFPSDFFTVLVAVPRMVGYLAHWKESLDDPDTTIMHPQQWYTGNWLRNYTPINNR